MRLSFPRFHPLAAGLGLLLAATASAADFRATIRDAKDRPLADAVVSLTPLDAPLPPIPAQTARVEIAQIDAEYVPFVTAVTVGTRVDFPNRDNIQHHLYSLSKPKRFEKPLYDAGSSESVLFDKPGVVTLGCNIHDWMLAYVIVLPTPWFARTGDDGLAAVAGLPAGRYRVEVWHPRLAAALTREITLADASPASESFTLALKPDRRIRRAPDAAAGGSY